MVNIRLLRLRFLGACLRTKIACATTAVLMSPDPRCGGFPPAYARERQRGPDNPVGIGGCVGFFHLLFISMRDPRWVCAVLVVLHGIEAAITLIHACSIDLVGSLEQSD